MPETRLRWALLSTARINRALIPAIRASARGSLLAVASRDAARARAYAAEWKIPAAYGSYEELLGRDDVDIVYIGLPNGLHVEWTLRALEAGKHVLIEKPIALRPDDVERIATAAARYGRQVAEAFMYRHHPQTLRLEELVASGAVGRLRLLRGTFRFNLDRPGDVRLDPQQGGGCLWDIGCYPVSLAQRLAGGPPQEVTGWQRLGPTGIDLSFVGQMRYASGLLAQFDSSFEAPFHTEFEVVGSEGSVFVAQPFKPDQAAQLVIRRPSGDEIVKLPSAPLYEGEVEDLHDAALGLRPTRVTLAESRGHIATLEALLASARAGTPVRLGP